MILCVTLNPCLDRTLEVPSWTVGDNVRGHSVRDVVGGKGNNVARALRRLGREARPVTFLGGPIGAFCTILLRRDDGLDPLVVPSAAPTRTILTVRSDGGDPPDTAFFDPDPAITAEEASDLCVAVEEALKEGGVEALTLSGSSPSTATHEVYPELVRIARAAQVPTFLDTYGPALAAFDGSWPQVMQLNRKEAATHLRVAEPSDADLWALLGHWGSQGVRLAVLTDGPRPVRAWADGARLVATPPTIEPVNPIGSGDSLLAGLVSGALEELSFERTLRRGVACAVANALVWNAGGVDPARVAELEPMVRVESTSAEG